MTDHIPTNPRPEERNRVATDGESRYSTWKLGDLGIQSWAYRSGRRSAEASVHRVDAVYVADCGISFSVTLVRHDDDGNRTEVCGFLPRELAVELRDRLTDKLGEVDR